MEKIQKENIKSTKVFEINKRLVVADHIEDAIAIYRANYEYPYNDIDDVHKVTAYGSDMALILR